MFPRTALIIAGLLVVAVVLVIFVGPAGFFVPMRAQMAAGSAYMKSLTEADIMQWISRTEKLLTEFQPGGNSIGVYGDGAKPIPPDLQQLKIVRIDILEDQVGYVWMGGMDHTELVVRRSPDGTFTLIARYDDARSEVIWPKRPNQAMQLTARKPVVYAVSVCHPRFPLRRDRIGLAAADLVSR